MSNLINHSKQNSAVNLDNVASIFHQAGKSKKIYFTYSAMNNENEMEVTWDFGSNEEAEIIYLKILELHANKIY